MKLFSRKSLIAAATSAVLISGALVAPASAQDSSATENTGQVSQETDIDETTPVIDESDELEEPEVEQSSSDEIMAGSSDEDGKLKASAIRDWIAVFTAIIGALSTVFVFADKLN